MATALIRITAAVCMLLTGLFMFEIPAIAGPGCDRNPDHPNWGDGGGLPPPPNPALVYGAMAGTSSASTVESDDANLVACPDRNTALIVDALLSAGQRRTSDY